MLLDGALFRRNRGTRQRNMVQQSTRRTIWCVDRTDKAPSLRQQLSNSRGLHLCEVLASVNTAEVRQVTREVELVSDDCEASGLLQIELRARHQIPCSEEIFHSFAN